MRLPLISLISWNITIKFPVHHFSQLTGHLIPTALRHGRANKLNCAFNLLEADIIYNKQFWKNLTFFDHALRPLAVTCGKTKQFRTLGVIWTDGCLKVATK